jgi:hypothetical protein
VSPSGAGKTSAVPQKSMISALGGSEAHLPTSDINSYDRSVGTLFAACGVRRMIWPLFSVIEAGAFDFLDTMTAFLTLNIFEEI